MATYECNQCGMSVNATCGKCDTPLQNGMWTWMMELRYRYQNAQMVMERLNHLSAAEVI